MDNPATATVQLQMDLEHKPLFRTVFQEAPLGIALGSTDGQILIGNPALQRMLGYTAAELCTMTIAQLSHPDDLAANRALLRELLAGERQQYQMKKRYLHKDGHVVWGRLTVSLVRDATGAPQFLIGMVEDITEQEQGEMARRKACAQLRETRQQLALAARLSTLGELAAGVAHELKNPLTSVIGYADLLASECPEDDLRRSDLEIIAAEARRAQAIVRNLLGTSRPSRGQRALVDLNNLLRQPLAIMRYQLERGGISVVEVLAAGLDAVNVDAEQLQQVALNLFTNASQAMPTGGTLTVTTGQVGAEVTMVVGDTGVGIAAENLSRIFEPFFSTKAAGTGLGLSVSRSIVKEHGGRITVESAEGQGSTFTVWLPSGKREWLQDVE